MYLWKDCHEQRLVLNTHLHIEKTGGKAHEAMDFTNDFVGKIRPASETLNHYERNTSENDQDRTNQHAGDDMGKSFGQITFLSMVISVDEITKANKKVE